MRRTRIGCSGCDTVGGAVASDTGDSRFESTHKQFYLISTVLYKLYRKDKNIEKGGQECPILNIIVCSRTLAGFKDNSQKLSPIEKFFGVGRHSPVVLSATFIVCP